MKIKRYIVSYLWVSMIALVAGITLESCVHEWPNEAKRRDVTISVVHDLEWEYLHSTYTSLTASRSESKCRARYIFRAYPKGKTTFVIEKKW